MNDKFIAYFDAINVSNTLRERIDVIYKFYEKLIPGEIEGVFITDHITDEGMREFDNPRNMLWRPKVS